MNVGNNSDNILILTIFDDIVTICYNNSYSFVTNINSLFTNYIVHNALTDNEKVIHYILNNPVTRCILNKTIFTIFWEIDAINDYIEMQISIREFHSHRAIYPTYRNRIVKLRNSLPIIYENTEKGCCIQTYCYNF